MEGRRYGEKATGLMLGPSVGGPCVPCAGPGARRISPAGQTTSSSSVSCYNLLRAISGARECRASRQCAVQSKRAHPPACRAGARPGEAERRLGSSFELKCELLQPPACHFGRTGAVEPLGNVLCNPSVLILLRAGGKPRRTGRLSDVWETASSSSVSCYNLLRAISGAREV